MKITEQDKEQVVKVMAAIMAGGLVTVITLLVITFVSIFFTAYPTGYAIHATASLLVLETICVVMMGVLLLSLLEGNSKDNERTNTKRTC